MILEKAWRSNCMQREYSTSLPPTTANQHITIQTALSLVYSTPSGLFSEDSRDQSLAKQPSRGFSQRVRCSSACGLFTGSYIKTARFSAKSSLSQGKLHLRPFISVLIYTHQTKYLQIFSLLNLPKRILPGPFQSRQPARVVKWAWSFNSGQHKVPALQSLEGMILYLINLFKKLPRNCLILHGWWHCFFCLINGVLEFHKWAQESDSSVL